MDEKFNKEEVWGKCLLFIKNRIQETAFQTMKASIPFQNNAFFNYGEI